MRNEHDTSVVLQPALLSETSRALGEEDSAGSAPGSLESSGGTVRSATLAAGGVPEDAT